MSEYRGGIPQARFELPPEGPELIVYTANHLQKVKLELPNQHERHPHVLQIINKSWGYIHQQDRKGYNTVGFSLAINALALGAEPDPFYAENAKRGIESSPLLNRAQINDLFELAQKLVTERAIRPEADVADSLFKHVASLTEQLPDGDLAYKVSLWSFAAATSRPAVDRLCQLLFDGDLSAWN